MTTTTSEPTPPSGSTRRAEAAASLRWWHEVILAGAFYWLYSQVRNNFGAGPESRQIAFDHAKDVIEIERTLGLWFEPALQQWYLGLPGDGYIRLWNIFYGTAHFIVTIAVLIIAFRKAPEHYRRLRTMLAGTTALALIGFASFTLMPPRLLGVDSPYGACKDLGTDCHGYGIIDTIDRWGGLWKFGEGGMAAISNQYAAMPSLHCAWSTWCAIGMVIVVGSGWKRWLWFLYPATTLFCILVTGNHFWLDAFFGLVVLAGGFGIALLVEWIGKQRKLRRSATPPAGRGTHSSPTPESDHPATA